MVLVFTFILSCFTAASWAHPVIYQEGWVLSQMSMKDMTDTNLSYSLTHRWSMGYQYFRLEDAQGQADQFNFFKVNHLLKRFNGKNSQANIYLHSGLGHAQNVDFNNRLGWMGGLEADWETRTLFTSLKYLHYGTSRTDHPVIVGRVGFSPFKADFNSLQSWAMLQVWSDPVTSREVKVTPLLRFFYQNVLWEMGASTKGDMMLNLMVHY